jgi:hypothetical protein
MATKITNSAWYQKLFIGWWFGVGFMLAYSAVTLAGTLAMMLFSMMMTMGG